ncbi:MAG TPA: hypothetical protein PKA88_08435 [Polyangiaceae bacterium]|nr:hypothetical protein [Polyangiaceae bacterium]
MTVRRHALPPTTTALERGEARPYFLWWLPCTVDELKSHLRDADLANRGYYLGALLREANTRDVWLFASPDEIRAVWPHVVPHLGHARARWAWLLGLPEPVWPPKLENA